MSNAFFPPRPAASPQVYAYEDTNPQYRGLLKVGYTTKSVQERVAAQYPTVRPGEPPYRIVLEESAMRNDGTVFTDHELHRLLRERGIVNPDGEWFACHAQEVRAAVLTLQRGELSDGSRDQDFAMRPEQRDAVKQTADYFTEFRKDKDNKGKTPHFLWNAKMRFGKTFASYQLAKKMGWKKVLVLTFKPAVQSAWESDLLSHVDFKGWQFIKPGGLKYEDADMRKPFVCFGSFQDYLGRNPATGGIKTKNEWVHATHWDCVILDEYHYGAWRDKAKDLFDAEDEAEIKYAKGQGAEFLKETTDEIEDFLPISADAYLYLSGTPFRAIASGEFIEEQIFNWTYSDEQRAKTAWKGADNPYAMLPRMVLLTYQLPDSIREIAQQGEFNEFDLNVFFAADGKGKSARFKYEDEVQKWLDLIRGAFMETTVDNLKQGAQAAPAVLACAPAQGAVAHVLVLAKRGRLPRNEKPARPTAKQVLSRLQGNRRGGRGGRHRSGCTGAGAERDERPAREQDDYAILRQADHRRHGQTVDGHLHAPQLVQSRDLLSGGVPRPVALDSQEPRWRASQRGRDHQTRVLCL